VGEEGTAAALQALQRQSGEERRIEGRLEQLHAEEAVLVENREQRLAQYTGRRQKDHSEAIEREVELSRALQVRLRAPPALQPHALPAPHAASPTSCQPHTLPAPRAAAALLHLCTAAAVGSAAAEAAAAHSAVVPYKGVCVQGQVSEEVERERRQWRKAQQQRQEAKHKKHQAIAAQVAEELIGLALLHAEYSSSTGTPVPGKVAREWLAMFFAGDSRLLSQESQVCLSYLSLQAGSCSPSCIAAADAPFRLELHVRCSWNSELQEKWTKPLMAQHYRTTCSPRETGNMPGRQKRLPYQQVQMAAWKRMLSRRRKKTVHR
jgi:hypothetical protein